MTRTVSCALVGLAVALGAPASAAAAARIAYDFPVDGIRTIRLDGTGARDLVDRRYAHDPEFSSDGRRLLFEISEKGIWLARADGSHAHPITGADADNGSLSPDGRRIAYEVDRVTQRGEREIDHYSVWIAGIDGSHRRRVHEGEAPLWTRDGRHLIYGTKKRGLVKTDLHGRHLAVLRRSIPEWLPALGAFDLSPDGTALAYLQRGAIHVLDIRTHRVRTIRPGCLGRGPRLDVVWSRDGRRLVYLDFPHHRRHDLEEIRPDGSGRHRLFRFPASQDPESLAFVPPR